MSMVIHNKLQNVSICPSHLGPDEKQIWHNMSRDNLLHFWGRAICFLRSKGRAIPGDFLEKSLTIRGACYADPLKQLWELFGTWSWQEDCCSTWRTIHPTSPHWRMLPPKCSMRVLIHTTLALLTHLAFLNCYFFPKIKTELGGHHFESDDDVITAVGHFLEVKGTDFFKEGNALQPLGYVCKCRRGICWKIISPL